MMTKTLVNALSEAKAGVFITGAFPSAIASGMVA